ncbi:glycoprotein 82 kDa [Trypanosoma cruzi]|nr:glycoprotein 82 kDa [Trypanosoma cruzi]
MLCTQRGHASGNKRDTALCLWVTDSNRTFYFGPVAVENAADLGARQHPAALGWRFASFTRRGNGEGRVISLSRLTEELSAINSVLSTWAQKYIFFSSLSKPTACLVAVLFDASNNDTWKTSTFACMRWWRNAVKDNDRLQLTGIWFRAIWPVNTRGDEVRHVFLSHDFTLVASVGIEEAPSGNTPRLTVVPANTASNHTMGLSCSHNKKWETAFEDKTTTRSSTWEPKKDHQLALMLQGNKASVHIDGRSLGEEEVLLEGERPPDVLRVCFGACGGHESHVTVKNVFPYNRPLNSTAMRALKDSVPAPTREAAPTPPEKVRVVGTVREHIAGDITEGK